MMHSSWGQKLREVFDSIEDPVWSDDGAAEHPLRVASARHEPTEEDHPSAGEGGLTPPSLQAAAAAACVCQVPPSAPAGRAVTDQLPQAFAGPAARLRSTCLAEAGGTATRRLQTAPIATALQRRRSSAHCRGSGARRPSFCPGKFMSIPFASEQSSLLRPIFARRATSLATRAVSSGADCVSRAAVSDVWPSLLRLSRR